MRTCVAKISLMQPLGSLVKQRRSALGITQEQLARRCGIATGIISALEQGVTSTVKTGKIAKLAKGLGVPIELVVRLNEGPTVTPDSNIRHLLPAQPLPLLRVPADGAQSRDDVVESDVMETRDGEFRAVLDGDCMMPSFPPGCVVTFAEVYDLESLRTGWAVYVEQNRDHGDGSRTFKRLVQIEDEVLILECANPERSATLHIPVAAVARVGRARAVEIEVID